MKKQMVLISFFLFVTLPTAGIAAEKASEPEAGNQRAACDAGCRENYQNNSAAMQACLRDCGAVGPASPAGAKTAGHEAAHTVQYTTTVKASKSNSDNRLVSPAVAPAEPAEASRLNSSKSNRVAEPAGTEAPPAAAAKGKPTKEQSSEDLQAAPDTDEMPPVEPEGSPPADG